MDIAVVNRLIDMACLLIGAATLIGAYQLIVWRFKLEERRKHRELRRRINRAAEDWPSNVQVIRRHVNHQFDKAA